MNRAIALLFMLLAFSGNAYSAVYFDTAAESLAYCEDRRAYWNDVYDGTGEGAGLVPRDYWCVHEVFPGNGTYAGRHYLNWSNNTTQRVSESYYRNPIECNPPNVLNPNTLECNAPGPQCSTDTIPGGDIMSSQSGTVGANSGFYDVGGCAYSCGVNYGKMDGRTKYRDTLECTGLGETTEDYVPDPDEGTPENCIVDSMGKEICASNNEPGCYQIGNQTVCPTQDAVCGEQNGTFQCVEPKEHGCGVFNGRTICYDPDGNYIDENSPDHPKNGGNADGDNTNDRTDPRSEADGGDPNNQPGKHASDYEGFASEKTLREIRDSLDGIGKTLKDGISGGGGGGSGNGSGDGDGDGDGNGGGTGGGPGDGDGDGDGLSFNGEAINIGLPDDFADVEAVQAEYQNLISSIRAEFSSSFGSFSGAGGLQDNTFEIHGVTVNNGLSKWADHLQVLGALILFAAAFLSVGIIMGGGK